MSMICAQHVFHAYKDDRGAILTWYSVSALDDVKTEGWGPRRGLPFSVPVDQQINQGDVSRDALMSTTFELRHQIAI